MAYYTQHLRTGKNHLASRLVALFMFSMLLAAAGSVNAETFRVGYFMLEPHAMPGRNGTHAGLAVEYFSLVAKQMGLTEVRFGCFPLKRLANALAHNRIDMILLMAKNPQRAAEFVYPEDSFCLTQPSIAVNAASTLTRVTSVEDLLPLTIQVLASAFRSPFIRDPRLQIEPLYSNEFTRQCFAKLAHNRIDACYQPDHYPLQFEADKPRYREKTRVLPLPEPPIQLYSVFSKQSAAVYLHSYEAALESVKRQTSYTDLFEKYIHTYRKEQ